MKCPETVRDLNVERFVKRPKNGKKNFLGLIFETRKEI